MVWSESDRFDSAPAEIVGTRIAADGKLLDPFGFYISTPKPASQWDPSVASSGEGFLVTWTKSDWPSKEEVLARMLDADGRPVGDDSFPITTGRSDAYSSSVAWDGSRFVVAWTDERADEKGDIYATRIDSAGNILDPIAVPIVASKEAQGTEEITGGGSTSLLTWSDRRGGDWDIRGMSLSPSGPLLPADDFVVAGGKGTQFAPDVVWTGDAYFTAWRDGELMGGGRLDPSTGVVDASVLVRELEVRTMGLPSLAWNGDEILLGYDYFGSRGYQGDVFLQRLDGDGRPRSPTTKLPRAGGYYNSTVAPLIASDGSGFLVISLSPTRDDPYVLNASRIAPSGVVLDEAPWRVSLKPIRQSGADVAFDGTNYLAAWSDSRTTIWSTSGAYAGRVDQEGRPLDGPGDRLAGGGAAYRVASRGSISLVVWDGRGIVGRRITSSGEILDKGVLHISVPGKAVSSPEVTVFGDDFFVVWSQRSKRRSLDVIGARVTAEGRVRSRFRISSAPSWQRSPSIASSERGLLATWEDGRWGGRGALFGARIQPDSRVLDPEGVRIESARRRSHSPSVASDGTGYLVSFSGRDEAGKKAIIARRLSAEGVVRQRIVISSPLPSHTSSSVAWSGAEYVVAWDDISRRNWISRVEAAVVSPDGRSLVDTIRVSPYGDAFDPSVTSGPPGSVAISYTRVAREFGRTPRIFIRLVIG